MRELTLILASTPKMGIGLSGTLPWPSLKKEMAYFARVTKRSPSPTVQNAVIMGRKTWDSIPAKFRPLPNRLNIVISRSISSIEKREDTSLWAGSLEKALQWVDGEEEEVGRVFVIGGAEIYRAALGLKEARRVLLTRVDREWECDAFFPLELKEDGEGGEWRRAGQEEMDAWVGEEVPRGRQVEKAGTEEETGYEFEMWERVD
ncbi:putative dihydrofolate reductase [Triangularia verruculosa]|uniref:Dihydrofolate reductase n=1 Tax=Triangularia verruculosa TaxID=2587418 RepID=A0AAN6XLV8_9PEZI|nr:putative dihydrofolate reductase [Triangularia verruculosa]